MVRQDVLVVGLGRMEVPQGHHLGHRWAGVGVASLQLAQGPRGGTLLDGIGIEAGGAVLAAPIRALAVEFGWVRLGTTVRNMARSEGREPHDQLGNEADSAEADRVHAVQGLGAAEVLRV